MNQKTPQEARAALPNSQIAMLLGLIALIPVLGFQFGVGNQVEQFSIIERMRNADFATGDFYIDSASQFGPRFYYSAMMAALANFVPLHVLIFLLTLLCNSGTAAATYLVARKFLRVDQLAAAAAAALAIANSSFSLSLASNIRFDSFQPASIAIPLCFFGFYFLFSRRRALAALTFSTATLFHPLIGLQTGVIAFGAYFFATIFSPPSGVKLWRELTVQICAGLFFLALVFITWGVPSLASPSEGIPIEEPAEILFKFRAPHHYLPSVFPLSHYLAGLAFCAGVAAVIFKYTMRSRVSRAVIALVAAGLIVLTLCALTLILVEVFDSALWTSGQTFRLLYIVKWVGFFFIGWQAALWMREEGVAGPLFAALIIATPSDAQPFVLVFCLAAKALMSFFSFRGILAVSVISGVVLLSVLLATKFNAYTDLVRAATAFVCLYLVFGSFLNRKLGVAAAATVVFGLIGFAIVNKEAGWVSLKAFRPTFTWNDLDTPDANIARWVRDNTPEGEVWMTPPDFEAFRLLAERAIVVDFTSIPFDGLAMREWKTRMTAVYGVVDGTSFQALAAKRKNYASFTPKQLRAVMVIYGANYAVLYSETSFDGPVIYENDVYKVVKR